MNKTDTPTLGKFCYDFAIDMKIAEIRKTINSLEARIEELEAIKSAPRLLGELPSLD